MEKKTEGFTAFEWAMAEPEKFDFSKEFEEQIRPLMKQLQDKCIELGIPFHLVVACTRTNTSERLAQCGFTHSKERAPFGIIAADEIQRLDHPADLVDLFAGRETRNMRMGGLGGLADLLMELFGGLGDKDRPKEHKEGNVVEFPTKH